MSGKKIITTLLLSLFAVGVFGISLWILLTMPSLQLPGLWVIFAVGAFGVGVAIAVFFKSISNQSAAHNIPANQLWLIKLLTFGTFVSAVLHMLGGGSPLWTAVQFGVAGYGVSWLSIRRKYN